MNVIDSDATLILTPDKELTGGSLLTRNYALSNGKPYLHLWPDNDWHNQLEAFITTNSFKILNVAGPREASSIRHFVYAVLNEICRPNSFTM